MKMQFLILLLSALLTAVCVSGCADDLHCGDSPGNVDEEVRISFSVESLSLTRSEQDEGMESIIVHAYLLFFPSDAAGDETVPLASVRAEASETDSGALSFRMPLQLLPDTDYRLMAVANADGYVPDGFSDFSGYLAAWVTHREVEREELHLYRAEPILARDIESLPMLGGTPDGQPFRFTMSDGGYQIECSLKFRRLVARIDVANIVREGFSVEGVALCNWRDAVAVASDSQIGNVCGLLSGSGEYGDDIAFVDVEEKSGFQQLQSALYSFPSLVEESGNDDNSTTALIIKAKYGDDTVSTYYRVNVGSNGNRSEIRPNTKYLITIQSVKGRGASTPEEAYSASLSKLVVSSVEGWDIDGGCAMDDNGNFIVLSQGKVEFEADHPESIEVRVLSSKGLAWNVEYLPSDESSADAFTVAKVSSSVMISPKGDNSSSTSLSGVCRVSGQTPQGTTLTVDISIQQKGEDASEGPVIPWNMPFALVPLNRGRVKIDQDARTIEIDGFDPDCFNSFIDIPFQVYVNSSLGEGRGVDVSSTLEWPLEGKISEERLADYTYCMNSFTSGVVCAPNGEEVSKGALHNDMTSVVDGRIIFISVGAMGPDDPAIVKEVKLTIGSETVVYSLTVKPSPTIIDDVMLMDSSGGWWLIMDRNIQQKNYTGVGRNRDKNGVKPQAYHYCNLDYMSMPFKFKDAAGNMFSESAHELYRGYECGYNAVAQMATRRNEWLLYYKYRDGEVRCSPFYEEDTINGWICPERGVLELCGERLRASKMRMFLVSEVTAKDGENEFPVCCYWPCFYQSYPTLSSTSYKHGYFVSNNGAFSKSQCGMVYLFCGSREVEIHTDWINESDDLGFGRLIRPLTTEDLEDYKTKYLGYGEESHSLTICHPDTYESSSIGWIPY